MSKPLPQIYFDLIKVRDALSEPTKWCKHEYHSGGGRICLDQAALNVAYQNGGSRERGRGWEEPYCRIGWPLLLAAQEVGGQNYRSLVHFNDHRDTTHQLILAVIDRAMVLAVREGL